MASTKEIKRRIKSVTSTKKITKAMELVAASKMKRSVSNTLASRLYATYSWEILTSLSLRLEDINHQLFNENESDTSLIVLITSNRGLCGGYNSQVIKKVISELKKDINNKFDIVTIGKKGDSAMRKIGQNITATFTDFPDNIKIRDIIPISNYILNEYKNGKYKHIYMVYTDFISPLFQKPIIKKLLPVTKEEIVETIDTIKKEDNTIKIETAYLFEGNIDELLKSLIEKIIKMQIYQMMLESNASEQSSRMMAMKNANEAAGEMIDDLTLVFNKARQTGITREISEISAGMASIN